MSIFSTFEFHNSLLWVKLNLFSKFLKEFFVLPWRNRRLLSVSQGWRTYTSFVVNKMLEYFDSFNLLCPCTDLLTMAGEDLLQLIRVSLRKNEGEQSNHLRHGHQIPLHDVFRYQISLFLNEVVKRLLSQNSIVQLFGDSFQIEILQIIDKLETSRVQLMSMPKT